MPEDNQLQFNINRVGDGPMFEVLINNVRLDITHVGQLFSIRISGLVNEEQVFKLQRMFAGNRTMHHAVRDEPQQHDDRPPETCSHPECQRFNGCLETAKDEIPFDGPYAVGPIIKLD